MIHGVYNARRYKIYSNNREIYSAGNNPNDSTEEVAVEDGVGLDQMRKFCDKTAKEMAKERGEEYGGIEEDEDESDVR